MFLFWFGEETLKGEQCLCADVVLDALRVGPRYRRRNPQCLQESNHRLVARLRLGRQFTPGTGRKIER